MKKILCVYHEMSSCMKGRPTGNNEYLHKKTVGYIGKLKKFGVKEKN